MQKNISMIYHKEFVWEKVPNLVFFIDDSLDYIEKLTMLANKRQSYWKQRIARETQADIIWIFLYIAKRYLRTNSKTML
jgi:hypothetical protein